MARTWITGSLCLLSALAVAGTARAESYNETTTKDCVPSAGTGHYGEALQPGVTVVPDPGGGGNIVCVPKAQEREPVAGAEGAEREPVAGAEEDCAASQVHFGVGSAELSDDARTILAAKASCLNRNTSQQVTIVGATDPSGSASYNQTLGEHRAEAVSDFLSQHGVAKDRLQTKSVGEEDPVCSDSSKECWARERRAGVIPAGTGASPADRAVPED